MYTMTQLLFSWKLGLCFGLEKWGVSRCCGNYCWLAVLWWCVGIVHRLVDLLYYAIWWLYLSATLSNYRGMGSLSLGLERESLRNFFNWDYDLWIQTNTSPKNSVQTLDAAIFKSGNKICTAFGKGMFLFLYSPPYPPPPSPTSLR